MSNLFWLTDEQMARLQPYFPKSHGRQRVDDRRVLSGIIFVNRNGLRWRDAPKEYGPAKTLYNRWKRWGDKGVFIQMMEGLAVPEAAERGGSVCLNSFGRFAKWISASIMPPPSLVSAR